MDDGKVNVFSPAMIEALHGALERSKADAKAIIITGRPGKFSAGFDLRLMASGPEAAASLVKSGARLLLAIASHPQPVVAACSGHSIALGALTLLCADHRIGPVGPFKIGLTEAPIGMPLPIFLIELVRERIRRDAMNRVTLGGQMVDPTEGAAIGFLDEAVEPDQVMPRALQVAKELAKYPAEPYAASKLRVREGLLHRVSTTLDDDIAHVLKTFDPASALR